jgi:hypothetical protein
MLQYLYARVRVRVRVRVSVRVRVYTRAFVKRKSERELDPEAKTPLERHDHNQQRVRTS